MQVGELLVNVKVGEFFTLGEFCISNTAARKGIDNTPPNPIIENIKALCTNILDPLRRKAAKPIVISSGYRCPRLNVAVGGASTSQHVKGQAADLIIPGMTIEEVCAIVRDLKLPFDQLIDEFGQWTHVSYVPKGRGEFLKARRTAKGVSYERMG